MRQWKHLWIGISASILALAIIGCEQAPEAPPKTSYQIVNSADGYPIHYEVAGQDETALVFVHCWTCNSSFWDGQFDALAVNYRVVRLDLVGHGASGRGRQGNSMAKFGADVAAVADDLKLQRLVLVGHSMGGPVSVEAAKQLGDRVIGVVGVDTFHTGFPYPSDEESIAGFVKPFEEDFSGAASGMVRSMFPAGAKPALVEGVVEVITAADQQMAVEAMYDIFRWNMRENPTALDTLGPRLRNINGDPLGDKVPLHESVVLVPGSGHFVQQEKPAEFNRILAQFVTEFEQRQR